MTQTKEKELEADRANQVARTIVLQSVEAALRALKADDSVTGQWKRDLTEERIQEIARVAVAAMR